MVVTVTKDTFAQFIHNFSQLLLTKEKIIVETIPEDELYINSAEYLEGQSDETYDMSDPHQQDQFFADLHAGK